ncbi:ADP-ribosylglycohydrolase family protein [Desulfosarcina sp. OttesenSCG-928-G10]|nr:ADP-ribosylglycohydrolase family protein [Desulfosarcina sp. OttesenSCG-928-G10]MDL2320927.1 ADP-ribosylglycohydrolase family protein [Desulfosarcina sp. OttesenSCG-928-B08]
MAGNNTTNMNASKAVGAMLGAAYGDALGWPNERATKSAASKQSRGPLHDFRKWTRRAGGRYYAHEEVIEAGEYSDDTQLILCLSRSLQKGDRWWDYFTQVELPLWSVYERGGGGATKRAMNSWIDGAPPWNSNRKPEDAKKYFDAGGNGVAMRVLPHILRMAEKSFSEIAEAILLDGIATHGHPRALLGALAYGFALWTAFCKDSTLGYGELIDDLIKNKEIWSVLSLHTPILSEWVDQAKKNISGYTELWQSTITEIMGYIYICRSELAKGALSDDDDVLKQIQCFDPKVSGAGTVAAMAAIYLASRHAADPLTGVVKAAFATGSDTDTIASMTGGLLGCINGSDWLLSVKQGIQDASYIEKTAFQLAQGHVDAIPPVIPIKRSSLEKWTGGVFAASPGSEVRLPDQRSAKVGPERETVGASGNFKIRFKLLTSEDGQRLYLKKIVKGDFGAAKNKTKTVQTSSMELPSHAQRCGSKIPVASFQNTIEFYRDGLGLTVKKQNSEVVVFEQGLVLVPLSYENNLPQGVHLRTMIYIQTSSITERFRWVQKRNLQIVSQLGSWGNSEMLFFRTLDPDGNVVEVFSVDNQHPVPRAAGQTLKWRNATEKIGE